MSAWIAEISFIRVAEGTAFGYPDETYATQTEYLQLQIREYKYECRCFPAL
jgi:hypothetical protein